VETIMASNIVPFPRRPANDDGGGGNGPQQPGLRAFVIYDEVPEGCIAFEIDGDEVAPHVAAGEFAIVDPADRKPMVGELFLIQWSGGSRQIIEVAKHPKPQNIVGYDGADYWMACWRMTMVTATGRPCDAIRWGDGPYRTHHFQERLIGRVIGIHQPDFRYQLREAA
jgi:hypothetical protein